MGYFDNIRQIRDSQASIAKSLAAIAIDVHSMATSLQKIIELMQAENIVSIDVKPGVPTTK